METQPELQNARNNKVLSLQGYIPALDGIRGFAILPVMLYHFTIAYKHEAITIFDKIFIRICGAGWLGVDLFFVLSGFLITGILYDTRQSNRYITSFYGRRFLRIFPAYYGILIVSFFILPSLIPVEPSRLEILLDNKWWFLSYLINWKIAYIGDFNQIPAGYIWSLAIEEQFYMIWPWIVILAGSRLLSSAGWMLAFSVVLRTGLLAAGVSATSVYVMTFSHLDGLLIGAILAVYLRTRSVSPKFRKAARKTMLLSAAALVVLFVQQGEFHFYNRPVAYIGYLLLSLCFCGLLATALLSDRTSILNRIVSGRTIRSFGKYSYCLYLIHHPVGTALEKFVFNPQEHPVFGSMVPSLLLFVIISTAACWMLAFISWHLSEKQFLKLKKHFSY